jgi:hypothetical protein
VQQSLSSGTGPDPVLVAQFSYYGSYQGSHCDNVTGACDGREFDPVNFEG